jgi:drug/metabolite transporter (DMT)-like permease
MNYTTTIEKRAVLAAGLTAVMWGLTGIFVRLLPPLSPFAVTTGRLLGALVVALPILAISNTNRLGLKLALRNPVGYALASLLAGYYLLATAAFQLAPVAEVALLLSTPPLFVLALRRVRGDVPTVFEILGAGLAVAGIALILAPRLTLTESFVNARLIGDALAICAAVLTALYAYLYRQVAKNGVAPEPTSVTFMTFALGSGVLIGILCLVPTTISSAAFRGSNLLIFLGLAVLCTAIPSFAYAFASKRLPPVVTATISLLIPLFAGAFAFVILGEKVPSTAIPGSVLVVAGIVMILRQNNETRPSGKPVHA